MRWFWIDRFTEFVSGQHSVAVKCVTLADEVLDDYAPGRPYFPSSMIIEGMAQAGGLMIDQLSGFSGRVVLAKIMSSEFFFEALPGDLLTLRCEIIDRLDFGSVVRGTVHRGDELQANIELMFANLTDERFAAVQLFEPAEFCRMIRLLKLFDVGVNPDGTPIQVPPHMVEAEQAFLLNALV